MTNSLDHLGFKSGVHPSPRRVPEPVCPVCRWRLEFVPIDYSWRAFCRNQTCKVIEVPATINEAIVEFLREQGESTTVEIAHRFGWKLPNANGKLNELRHLGIVKRRRVEPVQPGGLYVWSVQ